MAQIRAGRVEAFEVLYDRYADRAYRVAISIGLDDGRAQDAVQEAFLSVWRSRGSFRRERGTLAAWLLSTVRHRAIDLARRNEKHASRASDRRVDAMAAPEDVAEEAIRREGIAHVTASLAGLAPAQQEAIALAYYGGLSHSEIATRLGVPAGTVKGRIRLGVQRLRLEADSH